MVVCSFEQICLCHNKAELNRKLNKPCNTVFAKGFIIKHAISILTFNISFLFTAFYILSLIELELIQT